MASAAADAPLCLPPRPMTRPPQVALPIGTIDSQLHLFSAEAPLASPRSYTPQVMTLSDWQSFADLAGIGRGVVVQPSVYGFENSVLLSALRENTDRLRGVVVPHPEASTSDFADLDQLGVRGVRCNTRNLGGLSFDAIGELASKIAGLEWILQFQVRPEQLEALVTLLPTLGVRAIIDHLGFIDPRDGAAIVRQLRALLDTGNCYVKISGPYRLTPMAPYHTVGTIAAALVQSHPDRMIWGSDWPHTELFDAMPDDAELIDTVATWLNDPVTRQRIFVDNPHALFFAR